MRISRLDPDDPAGKRRRHFEISIDSPFTVLNCRATQANTALPEYSGTDQPMYRQQASCGCPDADVMATNPSPASSTGTIPSVDAGAHAVGAESPGMRYHRRLICNSIPQEVLNLSRDLSVHNTRRDPCICCDTRASILQLSTMMYRRRQCRPHHHNTTSLWALPVWMAWPTTSQD